MEARRRGPRRLFVHVAHTWTPLPVGEWVIGRSPESDIRIDDDRVSRRHAVVRASADGWELSDGGSLNGIWLDDKQVPRVAVPLGGVTVRFGGKDGVPVRLLPDRATAAAESSGRPDIDHASGADAIDPAPMTSPVGVRFEEVTPEWTGWAPAEPAEQSRLKALMRRVGNKRTAGPEDPGPAGDGS
jgi:ABC transport system ATP-binding/permease protein